VLEAAFWGFVGGGALLIGAVVALRFTVRDLPLRAITAFGAGVLISAATLDLTEEAFVVGGAGIAAGGLAAGSLSFFVISRAVQRRAPKGGGSANAIVVGAILDGIPESAAIGISLIDGSGVSTAVVVAVFLSNVPEALSSSAELRAGRSDRQVLGLWGAVAVACAAAAALGYGALSGLGGDGLGFVNAFAAGAIITTLSDTLIPDAVRPRHQQDEGPMADNLAMGVVVTLGFAVAALLSSPG